MKRLLITGSRDWTDMPSIWRGFNQAIEFFETDHFTLVSGACPTGADALCEEYGRKLGLEIERHPANWDDCGNDCGSNHWRYRMGRPYCPRAGFVRNEQMVKLGADACLAFIKDKSNGASMTARLAEAAGIPTLRFTA